MSHLSEADRQHFQEQGYLVVRGVLDTETVNTACDLVWENMNVEGLDRDNAESWFDKRGGNVPNVGQTEFAKSLVNESTVFEMAEELVGKDTLRKGGGFLAKPNFPRSDKTWKPPGGHLDGYPAPSNGVTLGTVGMFTVAVTMYVSDVKKRGGGFTLWPGSHRLFSDYFRTYPLDDIRADDIRNAVGEPFEFTGDAGDICFWHHWMYHTAGPNVGDDIRLALIARYSQHNRSATKFELDSGDLWRDWTAAGASAVG